MVTKKSVKCTISSLRPRYKHIVLVSLQNKNSNTDHNSNEMLLSICTESWKKWQFLCNNPDLMFEFHAAQSRTNEAWIIISIMMVINMPDLHTIYYSFDVGTVEIQSREQLCSMVHNMETL